MNTQSQLSPSRRRQIPTNHDIPCIPVYRDRGDSDYNPSPPVQKAITLSITLPAFLLVLINNCLPCGDLSQLALEHCPDACWCSVSKPLQELILQETSQGNKE